MMQGNDSFLPNDQHGGYGFDIPAVVLRIAGVIAVALFWASYLPSALVPLAVSNILAMAAGVFVVAAVLKLEHPLAAAPTCWDEAAVYLFVSVLAHGLVDPAAVEAAIAQLNAGT